MLIGLCSNPVRCCKPCVQVQAAHGNGTHMVSIALAEIHIRQVEQLTPPPCWQPSPTSCEMFPMTTCKYEPPPVTVSHCTGSQCYESMAPFLYSSQIVQKTHAVSLLTGTLPVLSGGQSSILLEAPAMGGPGSSLPPVFLPLSFLPLGDGVSESGS